MTSPAGSPVTSLVQRLLPRLRYPYLFLALAALLLVDLVLPDPLPLVDEAMLAVLTFLAGTWRTRREPEPPPEEERTALGEGDRDDGQTG
jgi:hypothetical protein